MLNPLATTSATAKHRLLKVDRLDGCCPIHFRLSTAIAKTGTPEKERDLIFCPDIKRRDVSVQTVGGIALERWSCCSN